jgi:hypothetical protein
LLSLTSRNLARVIWVHIPEREGEFAKEDLLAKMYCPFRTKSLLTLCYIH